MLLFFNSNLSIHFLCLPVYCNDEKDTCATDESKLMLHTLKLVRQGIMLRMLIQINVKVTVILYARKELQAIKVLISSAR